MVFEDTSRLLKILVMVGGDGGGRGRAMVQMPRLLQFYYKVGAGGVWATVEVRRLLKLVKGIDAGRECPRSRTVQ